MENLIDSNLKILKPFMFFPENMNNITRASPSPPISDKKSKAVKKVNSSALSSSIASGDFFIPYQKDKLFWCFYIVLFGMEKYEQDISQSFSVEKKLKFESIEMINDSLSMKLKELKIKRNDLENELLSNNDISLKCVYALCVIHSISLIVTVGKKYYMFDFGGGSDDECKIQNVVCRQPSGEFAVYTGNTFIIDSLYLVENVCKPIKSLTSYLITELKDLCNKMGIPIEDSNGKHKTKNKLYEEVLLFMQ